MIKEPLTRAEMLFRLEAHLADARDLAEQLGVLAPYEAQELESMRLTVKTEIIVLRDGSEAKP